MTVDNDQHDRWLANLRTLDVSRHRADRLRDRCHALLQPEPREKPSIDLMLWRVLGPALGGAWCVAYLTEVLRRAVADLSLLR